VSNVIPVDVAVPGCPPTPLAIMQGILTAIEPSRGEGGRADRTTEAQRHRET
jgi:Ni,Fe-hydrogenase III small subunit